MKKLVIIFLVLMLETVGQAGTLTPVNPQPRGVKAASMGFKNCIYTSPGKERVDYNDIKSSNWDSQWGALDANNWRCLVLTPGTYTLTGTWTLDANFVAIVSETGNPKDTKVTRATGGATINQTANTIYLQGFLIENISTTGGDYAFNQSATNNSTSAYRFMDFKTNSPYQPVFGTENIGGTWEFCNATSSAWRPASNKQLNAFMYRCISWNTLYNLSTGYGNDSFGSDAAGSSITGTLIECKAGSESFGGCEGYGCPITSTAILKRCEAGNNSYAMGKEFAGTAIDCVGGYNCFAGYWGTGSNYGTFSGYAENCTVKGGNSFGTGHASCVQSGIIINCRYGSAGQYAGGRSIVKTSTVTNNGAQAVLTTNLTGNNNDLVYTAREYGIAGNDITICYYPMSFAGTITVTYKAIRIYIKNDGTTTATQIKDWMNASAPVMVLVQPVTNANGNDGSGTIPAGGMAVTALAGGVNPVCFRGNAPLVPIACTANFTIYPFDNGAIYTNTGASAAITGTLPPALIGLKYTFVRTVATADCDVIVDPATTSDYIRKNDGTLMAAGESYQNVSDAYGEITLECKEANIWQVTNIIGTWVEETP